MADLKHTQARLLRNIQANKVATDLSGRIWLDDAGSHTGRRHTETPIREARAAGWCMRGTGGIEKLTAAGEAALAAHDTAVQAITNVQAVTCR